jgi:hypothetical protein
MQIQNQFEIPMPPAAAWPLLMDVPLTASCFPGAELTATIDADRYKGAPANSSRNGLAMDAAYHCSCYGARPDPIVLCALWSSCYTGESQWTMMNVVRSRR